jgi:hypothetical protein
VQQRLVWGPLAQWEVLLLPKEQWDTEMVCRWQEDGGSLVYGVLWVQPSSMWGACRCMSVCEGVSSSMNLCAVQARAWWVCYPWMRSRMWSGTCRNHP